MKFLPCFLPWTAVSKHCFPSPRQQSIDQRLPKSERFDQNGCWSSQSPNPLFKMAAAGPKVRTLCSKAPKGQRSSFFEFSIHFLNFLPCFLPWTTGSRFVFYIVLGAPKRGTEGARSPAPRAGHQERLVRGGSEFAEHGCDKISSVVVAFRY